MAESEFSWFKLASFLGALLLLVLASVVIASGIYQIVAGSVFHGVACILSGALCVVNAWLVYRNYQRK